MTRNLGGYASIEEKIGGLGVYPKKIFRSILSKMLENTPLSY